MVKRIPSGEARKHLADLLNDVAYRGQIVIITRNGKDVAAFIPTDMLRVEANPDG